MNETIATKLAEMRKLNQARLATWTFFLPSQDLTKRIIDLNGKLHAKWVDGFIEAATANSTGVPESELIPESFIREILSAPQKHEEEITWYRFDFSEKIFNHCAMLSRSAHAKKMGTFSLQEELGENIAGKIGLRSILDKKNMFLLETEGSSIFKELAKEFKDWLEKQNGIYIRDYLIIRFKTAKVPLEKQSTPQAILTIDE